MLCYYADDPAGCWAELLHVLVHGRTSGTGSALRETWWRAWKAWFEGGLVDGGKPLAGPTQITEFVWSLHRKLVMAENGYEALQLVPVDDWKESEVEASFS